MQKFAILISYLGTDFCGWQIQPEQNGMLPSIQETLTQAIQKLCLEKVNLVASGRTDAGVHATGQVAHFELKEKILPEHNLMRGLNTLLPHSIRVLSVKKVEPEFHAQHHALKKQYSYYFQLGQTPIASLLHQTTFDHRNLDVKKMDEAVKKIQGEHEFFPFQASDAKPGPTVRTLFETDVTYVPVSAPGYTPLNNIQLVRIRVVGSGFLKHMVRGIAGTLLKVGSGDQKPEIMDQILKTQDRSLVGSTAPAQGLWLEKLWYEKLDFNA
jgi:tRNA pseudouridine38-40 synthase